MSRYWQLPLAGLLMIVVVRAHAGAAVEIYDPQTLQRAHQVYAKNLQLVWSEDLLGRLTVTERQAAGSVRLHLPMVGMNRSPFDYYTNPSTRDVVVPILSVKFFDDLAIAAAWLTRKGCGQESVSDYVGILRYRGSSVAPANRFPSPLEALAIPPNALDDAFVNDVSGKTLKSAIYFLMAHELGHVIHQHRPYSVISGPEAQAQEAEADAFALNVMRRISVVPMGMVLFFAVVSRFEAAPGDFPTLQAFYEFARRTATHPLTSQRLLAVTKTLRDEVDAFVRGQNDPVIWRRRIMKIATDIETIGNTLDDPKIREVQRYRSERLGMSDLSKTCP